jgi:MoaA/NifB/PqqE/SkfB family radical SAM enzyme
MLSLNDFDKKIAEMSGDGLHSQKIDTLQVNLGLLCNQQCGHCHLEASPGRTESMQWPVMELVWKAAVRLSCELIDITGGAPERLVSEY